MSKKVLILSSSPRKGGNSDLLCDEFLRGTKKSGNDVEKIRVASKREHFILGVDEYFYFCKIIKTHTPQ